MKSIDTHDLVDMQAAANARGTPLRIDLIYAHATHPLNNTFKTAIYRPQAKLWLYRPLAGIVLEAARNAAQAGLTLVVTDGLRTTDAQRKMQETDIVKANPHWTAPGPGMLISPPGLGGHPRGMAVDVFLETAKGQPLDMGTQLDYFSTDPQNNPAARNHAHLAHEAKENRKLLDSLMLGAAQHTGTELLPLPSEWWDYRLPPDFYNRFAPLSDADLPPAMRMCEDVNI